MLKRAIKSVKEFEGVECARSKVFADFDHADYYYRSEMINSLKSSIQEAHDKNDEISEIECFGELYRILSSELDQEEKKKLFLECYAPLVQLLQEDYAKGALYYTLGNEGSSLNLSEVDDYYRAAVKLDNDDVVADENIFRNNPEMIFCWLQEFINVPSKQSRILELENLLNKLVEGTELLGEYSYKMASLRKVKDVGYYDLYYRTCIKVGYKEAVEDSLFLNEGYEDEFLLWFDSCVSKGAKPQEAMTKCLKTLWENQDVCHFSKSKHEYVQLLIAEHYFEEACREMSRFADDGHSWAERWLLDNVRELDVQKAISDNLIQKWFEDKDANGNVASALGLLFLANRRNDLKRFSKYYACISKFQYGEGEYVASVASFLEASGIEDFVLEESFLRSLQQVTERYYAEMILLILNEFNLTTSSLPDQVTHFIGSPVVESKDKVSNWECPKGFVNSISKAMKPKDQEILAVYFTKGTLPGMLFRQENEAPCSSRYFLLKTMSKMAENAASYGMSPLEQEIFSCQSEQLKLQSSIELLSSIENEDIFSLYVWIIHSLFSNESLENRQGLMALYALCKMIDPKKLSIHYLLLANFWNRKRSDCRLIPQILQWIMKDDADLNDWTYESDMDVLIKKVFAKINH